MPTNSYTTTTKMEKRLSADGVSLRQVDDSVALTQFIYDASDEIEFYCGVKYTTTVLATSSWVSKICTDICVYFYCWRRLNAVPEGVQKMFDFAIERLKAIQTGGMYIPGLVRSKDAAPVLSNMRVRTRPILRPVVIGGTSTKPSAEDYPQHLDSYDNYIDYTI